MKTLVYGIDGMSAEILRKASPEFAEYLKSFHIYDIDDDTLGRGWTKIISGQPPQVTNGYFQMPVADGSYKIEKNYNLSAPGAATDGRFEYLWDVAERLGKKAVFVNIPTTSPAPSKSAGFISGIGGGRYPKDGFDDDLFYPSDIKELIDSKYKIDVRLNVKYPTIEAFCSAINEVHQAQAKVFSELFVRKDADVGFYVNKLTVEILNLALYDVLHPEAASPAVRAQIKKHFSSIYSDFEAMLDRIMPDRVILVSDHGTESYRYDVNIDLLLEQLGFLTVAKDEVKKRTKKFIGQVLPEGLKKKVKSNLNLQNKRFPLGTPTANSAAFGSVFDTGNFCGVYLNDQRFGGNARTGDQALIMQICNALNDTPEFRALGMSAEPYDPRTLDSSHAHLSPDIRVRKPDDVYCQRYRDAFLRVNPNYRGIEPEITDYRYPNTGIKSSKALLASNFPARHKPASLCDAHSLIVQAMEESV